VRSTLTDIAREAGVSAATVDRVLNNRPGVRARTREIVLEMAQRLGYIAETQNGAPQKMLHGEVIRLDFALPAGTNSFIKLLHRHIEAQALARPDLDVRVTTIEGFNPDRLARLLQDLHGQTQGVGVIALDHPTVREAIRSLSASDIKVVTIASDILHVPRVAYIGIDNRAAGRLAGYLLNRFMGAGRPGKVALFAGSLAYRGHEEREMGFRSVLGEEFPNLTVSSAVEINDEPGVSYTATMKALHNEPELLGIYCVGAGRSGVAKALLEARPKKKPVFICHDLTRETRGYLVDDLADVVIDQNARLIAEQSVIRLLGSIASSAPYLTKKFIEPRLIFKENVPVQ